MRVLRREATYRHSPEDVWTGLTDARALAEWLMPTTFKTAEVGHHFRFQYDPDPLCPSGVVDCEILACEPPHRMVWSWRNRPPKGKPPAPAMRVEWILTPVAEGTRLQLIQTGLEGQPWLIPLAMGWGWRLYLRRFFPRALAAIDQGVFTPGAIPIEERAYKAAHLPPEVTI
ncbi:hypothetical protein GVN21_06310 [Caulobacter sp. SLTY]|uniref:SRPBCC family protein n=1 Tax=Caulobacter sp. SLTY TaxID=2683262 RepID=UPI0014132C2D|nr:SRPBCC domain-containing protein [Caulobacter sp. SLTY]NBB14964.1 hypothetical protein [Caulobacter sp. SLTY]